MRTILAVLFVLLLSSCTFSATSATNSKFGDQEMEEGKTYEVATLGAGCFWCIEAIFQQVNGVIKVESGYAGGAVKNPTYKQICTGKTGHAEVAQITFDPALVSFDEILEIFWQTHDPTTLNRQGNDVGTQYRSAVFCHNEKQKEKATYYMQKLEESGAFDNPIVTEITALDGNYYPAEKYHQNYFNDNGSQPYCSIVIKPKVDKFQKAFKDKIKK